MAKAKQPAKKITPHHTQPVGEEPARVHAQVHGRGEGDEGSRVLGAPDVRHPDLHRRLAAPALALDRGGHDEAAVVPQGPLAQFAAASRAAPRRAAPTERLRGGQVDDELAALGRGDGGVGPWPPCCCRPRGTPLARGRRRSRCWSPRQRGRARACRGTCSTRWCSTRRRAGTRR
jgi:hypothetical protein